MFLKKSRYWLALTLVLFLPAVANGDSMDPPYSYVRESPDGKYLFVMLAPRDNDSDWGAGFRSIFPASGMYLNDVSRTPLWTVDWYAYGVLVFSDGVHVIRHGPWAEALSDEAITFFANGKMLRSYRIGDLVDTSLFLDRTVSHFNWEDDTEFDENDHTFSLATISDEKYTFDYTTGEIISARRPLRAFFVLVAVTALFLVLRRFYTR